MKSYKGQTNFWMIGFFILLIGAAFFIGKNYQVFFPKTSQPTATTAIGQSTSTPYLIPSETVILSPTVFQKSDLDGIKEAFAKKYNKQIDQVEVTVSKNDGIHASGGITFSGETSGGWFLAYKNPTGWIIVQDGNGTVSCETIAPYDFPSTMVTECVDINGNLIKK